MRKVPGILLLIYFAAGLTTASGQAPLQYRDTSNRGPQTFAIVMGVSKYKYIRPLTYADKDAELFRDYLKSPGGGSVKDENIFCLLNEQAINSVFWSKGFQWLKAKKLQRGDRLFIYLAGHGDAIDEDQFFFLSYDCNPGGDKNNYLAGGAIQLYNLKKKIAAETSRGVEVFFIMDACRSNELPGGNEGLSFLNTAVSQKKAGEIMMLATAAGQESLEDSSIGNGHGLFTWYLVDGLSGVADSISGADNKVTFQEIKKYVESNVPSVALQRFKRKQEPYFCCDENSEKVISTVNTAYLEKWLQTKRMQQRGPGNSFYGTIDTKKRIFIADTALLDTYNKFYQAIRNNIITGNESAEFFYQQLTTKFPENPYTLDARSTLTVEYINYAQALVNRYLDCGELTDKEKQQNNEAGARLEKAITILREEEEDFASSLSGRMYFLKASGAYPDAATAFQFAHAALAVNPDAAYILNRLATLHLNNNRLDSAQFYAEKATRIAPKWTCAATTLALVKKATENSKKNDNNKRPARKNSFGINFGGGLTKSNPGFSGNTNTGFAGIDPASAGTFNLGLLFQAQLGSVVSIRPSVSLSFDNTSIDFLRRAGTGGPITIETVSIKTNSITAALPLIIRLGNRNTVPYFSLGPSFSYLLGQSNATAEIIPVKKSLFLADAGLGLDIGIPKAGIILSPEIKYSAGLSEWKDETVISPYTTVLSSLKKQAFTLNIYLRKR
ncbi:MAG TPA: caspase family protein [Chitinophagaceae bacterium]|nr:caspase family protein [Chitinophagaceae bacterium]HNU14352.1 caspase family protein [Chitinophagaceae bacterium]